MIDQWRTVKVLHLTARIAWMPEVDDSVLYLATGTSSDNYTGSYEMKPELDIYSLNLNERAGSRLRFHSSLPTVARYLSIYFRIHFSSFFSI